VQPADATEHELLIPFVDRYVSTVDQTQRQMTVDWEKDY
jgi:ribosomal 30S subunit maturation factor RimM